VCKKSEEGERGITSRLKKTIYLCFNILYTYDIYIINDEIAKMIRREDICFQHYMYKLPHNKYHTITLCAAFGRPLHYTAPYVYRICLFRKWKNISGPNRTKYCSKKKRRQNNCTYELPTKHVHHVLMKNGGEMKKAKECIRKSGII
jgi:hypothetical protein